MGCNIASCGHKLGRWEPIVVTVVATLTRDGKRATASMVLCKKCRKRAKQIGTALENELDEENWIQGLEERVVW